MIAFSPPDFDEYTYIYTYIHLYISICYELVSNIIIHTFISIDSVLQLHTCLTRYVLVFMFNFKFKHYIHIYLHSLYVCISLFNSLYMFDFKLILTLSGFVVVLARARFFRD